MAVNLSAIRDLLLPGLRGLTGKYEQIPVQYDKYFTKMNSKMALGDAALIEVDGVEIVLTTIRGQAVDTDLFTQLGCDLTGKKLIVVKSSQHFYASYTQLTPHVIYASVPGTVTQDYRYLQYRHIQRPKWPMDSVP